MLDRELFEGGEEFTPDNPMENDHWWKPVHADLGLPPLFVHPSYFVGEEEQAALNLFMAYREGILPEAGGYNDQMAATMASIRIISGAYAELTKPKEGPKTPPK